MSTTEGPFEPVTSERSVDPSRPGRRRLLLSGATGRLGRAFATAAVSQGWTIIGAVASEASPSLGRPLSDLGVEGVSVRVSAPEHLVDLLPQADLYVSAAPASALRLQLPAVADAGIPAIVASTGFDSADARLLEDVAARIPLVIDPNFSIGMSWVHRAIATLGDLPGDFDVTVLEAHRRGKRDRPSGTALALAAHVHTSRTAALDGRGGPTPPAVEVASLRVGEMPGVHEVWIGGPHEFLRVEHVVLDRAAFAEGMLAAASWVAERDVPLDPGRYAMSDVLDRRGGDR